MTLISDIKSCIPNLKSLILSVKVLLRNLNSFNLKSQEVLDKCLFTGRGGHKVLPLVQQHTSQSLCQNRVKTCFGFFKNFNKRIPQMTFIEPFKHKKELSQEFWMAQLLSCRNAKVFHGRPGHNGLPCSKQHLHHWKAMISDY